ILIEREKKYLNNIFNSFPITKILIIFGIFIPWTLSFRKFYPNIRYLYASLLTGQSLDKIGSMKSVLDMIGINSLDFLKLLITEMGDNIIFLILSIVATFILFGSYKNDKVLELYQNLIILISITFIIGLAYATYLFSIIPGLETIAASRLLNYLILLTPIFAGFSYNKFLMRKRNPIIASLSIFLIMTSSIISIFSLYYSPYVFKPNCMVTKMDIYGFQWSINKTENIGYVHILHPVKRLANAILGFEVARGYSSIKIQEHFNYTNYSTLGKSYQENKYLVIT
ncbi:unnamed protein product, partial [marine sediment metagenome]